MVNTCFSISVYWCECLGGVKYSSRTRPYKCAEGKTDRIVETKTKIDSCLEVLPSHFILIINLFRFQGTNSFVVFFAYVLHTCYKNRKGEILTTILDGSQFSTSNKRSLLLQKPIAFTRLVDWLIDSSRMVGELVSTYRSSPEPEIIYLLRHLSRFERFSDNNYTTSKNK